VALANIEAVMDFQTWWAEESLKYESSFQGESPSYWAHVGWDAALAAAPSPQAEAVAEQPDERAATRDAIAVALGSDAYDCTRVWSAWNYGTMGPDDFRAVVEDENRLDEIVDAVIHARAASQTVRGGEPVAEGFAIVPDYRGYAHLGIGQYLLNSNSEFPELVISIATSAEKEGRTVGDLIDNPPGHLIRPEDMCVRIRFENVAGLDALEQQLRFVREEHFSAAPPGASPLTTEALLDEIYTIAQSWDSGIDWFKERLRALLDRANAGGVKE
jgi:hypothetical protein